MKPHHRNSAKPQGVLPTSYNSTNMQGVGVPDAPQIQQESTHALGCLQGTRCWTSYAFAQMQIH